MKVRCVDCYQGYPTQGITLCERHQSFHALLAVAKAATFRDEPGEGFRALANLTRRLDELDAAHPGWREWV